VSALDAERLAVALLGDSIYANPLLLGHAWQQGCVPVGLDALRRAIELNGTRPKDNLAAFEWGRRAAHDLPAVQALADSVGAATQAIAFAKKPSLDEVIARREAFLADYQDAAYAARWRAVVEKVRAAESALPDGPGRRLQLTDAVARYLFKLMAYKDEYEVARLHADTGFVNKIAAQFDGDYTLRCHLAPPLLGGGKDAQGRPAKRSFGPWMLTAFKVLAKFKGLRGTAFDPFGHTAERRTERALVGEYVACVEELLAGLTAANLAQAVEIARLPEHIRGYGPVKARHLAEVRPRWDKLMGLWRDSVKAGVKPAAQTSADRAVQGG